MVETWGSDNNSNRNNVIPLLGRNADGECVVVEVVIAKEHQTVTSFK